MATVVKTVVKSVANKVVVCCRVESTMFVAFGYAGEKHRGMYRFDVQVKAQCMLSLVTLVNSGSTVCFV